MLNKKLLLSLMTVGLVVGGAVLGTRAFFSDTEKSTGNTLTSGSVDLQIDYDGSYNGESIPGWSFTDLTNEKFFDFSDLKPGDYGEGTISLHVIGNDAHGCLTIDNMHDNDNGLTDPEMEAGDSDDGVDNGELANEIHFFAWADDGDNIWESGEAMLFSNTEGPASDVLDGKTYPLGELDGTSYIGIYWCYGSMTVDELNHALSCSGSGVSNQSQTDTLSADITFAFK